MELRDIEIFLVLAEELHFGRVAERLHVSPARVSQAIKAQERRIGAQLFERTSRSVRMTEVGRQLRDDLRPVYAGLHESLERARMAARGVSGRLRIGMIPGNAHDLRLYWQTFRSRHPQWELSIRHAPFNDPFGGLRRGDIDVLVAWLPVREDDLTVGPVLLTDPRMLAVAVDHELATRTSVSVEMLADFQHTDAPQIPGYWADSFVPAQTPRGRTIERGPMVTTNDEIFTLVSAGDVVNVNPSHVTRYWGRPDILWLPFNDLGPLNFGLVWRTETENPAIRALAETVRHLGTLQL
ncbi:LysR family transcriptional regulator [Streptomyces sp. NRRL B-1568]|nr:LysR family transcriptional regulator [Streptomyces sp. NRRL B-1568]